LAPNTVQGIKASGSNELIRQRKLLATRRCSHFDVSGEWDWDVVNVGERGELIYKSIPGKERSLTEDWEVRPWTSTDNEVAFLVSVAAAFAANIEIELHASLAGGLTEVATATGAGLLCSVHAAIGGVYSGCPDGVVKE